jgi:hypothetical protein
MDWIDGVILGGAISAVVGIVVTKYINLGPTGGAAGAQPAQPANQNFGQDPSHPLYVVDLNPTPGTAAPVAQVNPNTEAAYNVQPVAFTPAFGPGVNQASQEVVLPQ